MTPGLEAGKKATDGDIKTPTRFVSDPGARTEKAGALAKGNGYIFFVANTDDVFPAYWLDEPDWLVAIAMLSSEEVVENDLEELNWIGRLFAFTQATDTWMLALVGDPDGPTYELLFSFSSDENKRRFLELVKLDGYADPLEEGTFTVPDEAEIRDARPISHVFPQSQADYITQVALVTMIRL